MYAIINIILKGVGTLDIKMILLFVFFTILISIQYSLNRILIELKDIRKNLYTNQTKINFREE